MTTPSDKSTILTSWGVSLLNKLPAVTRNKRKRDASKRRRLNDRAETAAWREGRQTIKDTEG